MLREIGFSHRWGYGELVKVNIYPFRSPSTSELMKWLLDGRNHAKVGENWERIGKLVRSHSTQVCVAAWGNIAALADVRKFLNAVGVADWQCLGTTMSGAPKHTLARGVHRIPDTAFLIPWTPNVVRTAA
jgi:hypothetical protein